MTSITSILLPAGLTLAVLGFLVWRASKFATGLSQSVREELRIGREEARSASRDLRDEMAGNAKSLSEGLRQTMDSHATQQSTHNQSSLRQIQELSDANRLEMQGLRESLDVSAKELRLGNESKLDAMRKEVSEGLKANVDLVTTTLERLATSQQSHMAEVIAQQREMTGINAQALERIRDTFNLSLRELQDGNDKKLNEVEKNVSDSLAAGSALLDKTLQAASVAQQGQIDGLTKTMKDLTDQNQIALERIRTSFDIGVKDLQASNEQKLEEMRKTVDEKLHDTLEKRLGESFKQVSDRLETVHKGLGEMQKLASGVGDLKRVLTNVKVRGTWSEVQLGAILEQMLTPDQWDRNVRVREGSLENVEFAIRLPGPHNDPTVCTWLPIDSKFPKEDYLRLQTAAEAGDADAVQGATEALIRELRRAAKDIHEKYVNPPATTDFAIMFLATEGLYAEALRQQAFVEELQQRYRVIIAGPTNLAAILSSLRMGFQTLAVEQRAADVWRVLGAVKTEFQKFGGVLERVKRQLATASRTIDETGTRSRAMERQLRSVEQLNPADAASTLALPKAAAHGSTEELEDQEVGLD